MSRDLENLPSSPSIKALDRPAMLFGVPIVPFMMTTLAFCMTAMVMQQIFGPLMLLLAFMAIPVLMWLRLIVSKDVHALSVSAASIRVSARRRNHRLFAGSFTLSPIRYGYAKKNTKRVS